VARRSTPGRYGQMGGSRENARPELLWFARHDAALKRWPVIAEQWAERLEQRRLEENAPKDIAYLHGAGR